MKTVVVQSPSAARELGVVLRVVAHVVLWSLAAMFMRCGPAENDDATASVAGDDVPAATLDADLQRMYRRCLGGLADAEVARSRLGAWPTVAEEAARGIPPFAPDPLDRGGYRWRSMTDGVLVNYVGVSADPTRPVLAIAVVEPQPGSASDPLSPVDEEHHRLHDGTLLHVWIGLGPRDLSGVVATPPFELGWRRIRSFL